MTRPSADAELEWLVTCAAAGDDDAWRTLWSRLEPRLTSFVRKRTFVGRSQRPEDEARDVVVAVMARLHDQGYRRLKQYLAARGADPTLGFMRWLLVVAKHVAIDVMRAHPDYVDLRRAADEGGEKGLWIAAGDLPDDDDLSGGRPPMTNRLAARQILEYAGGVLTDPQRRALELWVESGRTDEIARELALSGPDEAERLVRAAVERLRRHFRKDPPG